MLKIGYCGGVIPPCALLSAVLCAEPFVPVVQYNRFQPRPDRRRLPQLLRTTLHTHWWSCTPNRGLRVPEEGVNLLRSMSADIVGSLSPAQQFHSWILLAVHLPTR